MFVTAISAGSHISSQWWFGPACVLAGAVMGFALHKTRLHSASIRLREGFKERLAMRTRVAQELHDGMLQSVVSASMQLHAAIDQLPKDSPALPTMNHVLKLMGEIVEDGRHTLQGLRSSIDGTRGLADLLAQIPEELGNPRQVGFRLEVQGFAEPLRPIINDGVYGVVRLAIMNAFRHCRVNNIAVQLLYSPASLAISVRDDGCGIDPEILRQGGERDGRLAAMRAQAEKMGGTLKIWSRPEGGTEVEFHVPGHIAFESHGRGAISKWLPNLHWLRREPQPAIESEAE